jgi:predicted RNA binding protein YcfA (HicA-like mRNA interferase family)
MSKKDKLIERFLLVPKDFTWEELVKVLSSYGYTELGTGKTGGSRRRFADVNKNVLTLHKPHPSNVVKQYAIRQVIEDLKEKGKIKDDE